MRHLARHQSILYPVCATMHSDQATFDAETIQRLAEAQLVRLGLLNPRFQQPKKGESPEFNTSTGMLKSSGVGLSPLGRLLLREIGVAGPDDL
jgi:hypothetical protein